MKLNEEGLRKFIEIFEIKANSVILIEKKECMTVIINSVIILNLRKELFQEFFFLHILDICLILYYVIQYFCNRKE